MLVFRRLLLGALLCVTPVGLWSSTAVRGAQPETRTLLVLNAQRLPARDIPAERTPLGIPEDYKPFVTQLKSGDLLIVAFCFGPIEGIEGYIERAVFWRSQDGGQTWGPREERPDIRGREFGLTTLHDGTLLMTCSWLGQDALNPSRHGYSKIFRSVDEGHTWSEIRIGPDGFPDRANTVTEWMAFEIPDKDHPDNFVTCLGVSMQSGKQLAPQVVRLWRSTDSGKTWDKSLHPDTAGWFDVDGYFSQSVTFRTASGVLLHPVRVDRTGPHWHIPGTPEKLPNERGDQGDRMMLWESNDDGQSWHKHGTHGNFGTYGEMYSRFLQLRDGRVLLTFTVRSNSTDGHSLGLRAILSSDEGRTWDFTRDRILIGDVNHGSSGGGFGNTIELPDGTLCSVHSYRGTDNTTHVEAVRWAIPPVKP
jgi:hypothetical protein